MRWQELDCQDYEAPQDTCPARLQEARPPLHQADGGGPESIAATVFERQAGSCVGDRHHLYSDRRRVAVPGGGDRSLLTPDHQLVDERLAKEIVLDALLMAVWRRKPQQDVMIHSDQGSQFSSEEGNRFCQTHGLLPSMSRRGNGYDNAVVESFFGSLKKEKIPRHIFKTREEARAAIFDYIEGFYNRARRHQHLGNISPAEYELQMAKLG